MLERAFLFIYMFKKEIIFFASVFLILPMLVTASSLRDFGKNLDKPFYIHSINEPLIVNPNQSGLLIKEMPDRKRAILEVPPSSVFSKTTFNIVEKDFSLTERDKLLLQASLSSTNIPFIFSFKIKAQDEKGKEVNTFPNKLLASVIIPGLLEKTGFGLYQFDPGQGAWVLVSDAKFSEDKIVFSTNHLTDFAVLKSSSQTKIPELIPFVGDIDNDNRVDLLDLNTLMIYWGKINEAKFVDINNDKVINIFDFNLIMVNWTPGEN